MLDGSIWLRLLERIHCRSGLKDYMNTLIEFYFPIISRPGQTFALSSTKQWVRPVAVALALPT